MINAKNTCANITEFWTTIACLRDRRQNTQCGKIPSIHGDRKGFLTRKDASEIKQKSKDTTDTRGSLQAQCARIQTQMLCEHPTA